MPIMKFRCTDCGKEFAKLFFGPEQAPKTCTVCGGPGLEVLGPAFPEEVGVPQRPMCMTCDSCDDLSCGYIEGT